MQLQAGNRGWGCLLYAACCLLLLLPACGTKTPPTLKAYEKPPAPTDLTAVHREDKVILSWAYPESLRAGLKGFQVLRSEGQGFEKIGFLTPDKNSFEDPGFKYDNRYKYNVVAKNLKDVFSKDANIITVIPRTLPAPPANVRFSIKPDSVELSWNGSGEGVCYNIYRSDEKGFYSNIPINSSPVCNVLFRDYKLYPAKTIYYSIRALLTTQIKDEGYASEELEVRPLDYVPSVPADIRFVRSENKVHLTWKENPETWIRGYCIYRRLKGETGFSKLGEVSVPAFTDSENKGMKASYLIKAAGPVLESEALEAEIQ